MENKDRKPKPEKNKSASKKAKDKKSAISRCIDLKYAIGTPQDLQHVSHAERNATTGSISMTAVSTSSSNFFIKKYNVHVLFLSTHCTIVQGIDSNGYGMHLQSPHRCFIS